MSAKVVLNAEQRPSLGKGHSRRLRQLQNKVPGILYGGGEAPTAVMFEYKELVKAVNEESFYSKIVTINVNGNPTRAIVKAIQRHPAKEKVQHLDFQRIRADQKITVHVPLHFINEAACVGIKGGGVISHQYTEVEVRCLPDALPEFIEVDMANVELNQSVHLSDLKVPGDVEIVALTHDQDHPVASVHTVKVVEEIIIPAADATVAATGTAAAAPAAAGAKAEASTAKPAAKPAAGKSDKK